MATHEHTHRFNTRAFVSVGLFVSGIVLPISGVMNHVHGFEPLTTTRHFWMSVHNMAGLLCTVFALVHGSLNRRALMNYVSRARGVVITKEAVLSAALVLSVVFLFARHAYLVPRP